MTTAPRTASLGGITAHVEAFALLDAPAYPEIVLLSIVGTATACKAIWAGLLEGKGIDLGLGDRGNAGRYMHVGSPARYRTYRSLLPRLGLVHRVIAIDEALPAHVTPGRDFYVLTPVGDDSIQERRRFKAAWDRAIPHPAPYAWTVDLMTDGRAAGLVRELTGWTRYACAVLEVRADADAWAPVVQNLARRKGGLT